MKRKLKRRSVNRKVPKRFRKSRGYETRWQKMLRTKSMIASYDMCECDGSTGASYFLFPKIVYVGSVKSRIRGNVGGTLLSDRIIYESETGKAARDDMFKYSKLEMKFVYHEKKTN